MLDRITRLLVLLLLSVTTYTGAAWTWPSQSTAASYLAWPASPQGSVGISKPEIQMKFEFTDLDVSDYGMELNGTAVDVQYDKETTTFRYTPEQALKPGDYEVRLNIAFSGGYEPKEYEWEFTVTSNAISQFPEATEEQEIALQAINRYRKQLGLHPVTLNPNLNAAATAHAEYQNINGLISHDELRGKPGFIGENVRDRTSYFGYSSKIVMEDISQQSSPNPVDAIDALFDAPYHRIPFLYPTVSEIGYGRAGNYHVINFGADLLPEEGEPQVVISPGDKDAYVPASWDGHEIPDPLRIHAGAEYPTGYPIMVGVYGGGVAKAAVLMVEMKDQSGAEYPHQIYWNSAGNQNKDSELSAEVLIIPSKPLEYDATYRMRAQILVTYEDGRTSTIQKEWTFTTEPSAGAGKKLLHLQDDAAFSAAPPVHTVTFGLDDDQFTVDGESFPVVVKPLISEGYSYLAIRDLEKALDAEVEWDETNKAAIYRKGDRTVVFDTDDGTVRVNGRQVKTETPAMLVLYGNESRTMVPVRLLSESLGCTVDYVDETRTVIITYES